MTPVNGWSLFGHDPEDCEPTKPKQKKAEGDRYSISSAGYPLKNGKQYASSAGYQAGEIFNIVMAQGGGINSAYGTCRNAFTSDYRAAQQIGGNMSAYADGYQRNLGMCDKLYQNYRSTPSILRSMSNNKTYQRKSSKKADGYYEICYRSGTTSERYTYKNNQKDGLYESYYDNAQLEEKSEYKDGYLDGVSESYYSNGQLKEKVNYDDRKKNGDYELYYDNAQLKENAEYKDGYIKGCF